MTPVFSQPSPGYVANILKRQFSARRATPTQSPVGAASQKLTLLACACFPDQVVGTSDISEITGLSDTQTSRALTILRNDGLLSWTRTQHNKRIFKVTR